MATRDIKTRLKLEGEAEYKKQLGEIDGSLKTLRSEMKKVSAEYEGNADSVEALNAKNQVLEKQLDEQQKKVSTLRQVLEKAAEAYGEADSRTQSWQRKLNDAEADLYKLQHQMDDNRETLSDLSEETEDGTDIMGRFGEALKGAADKLGVQLPEGAGKAIGKLSQLNPKAGLVVTTITMLATALAKANAELKELTELAGQEAYELERLASITGLNVEQLQEFEYAAGQLNIPADALSDSLKDLTNKAYDAANGNEELAGKFQALGVSILDTDGQLRDSYSVFLDLIDALGEVDNQTERDALAMELLNESARQLNPLIEEGSGALQQYAKEARDMSAVLSQDQVQALADVEKAQLAVEAAQKAVSDQLAGEYGPYMEETMEMSREMVEDLGEAFQKSGVAESLGSMAVSLMSMLEPLAEIGTDLLPVILGLLDPIAGTLAWIADTANAAVGVLTLPFGGWDRLQTALGFNADEGRPSNMQIWQGYDPNFDWNTWQTGYNAGGTPNFRGGVTWVGENGPERVWLPAGSQIDNAQESRSGGGDTYYISISARDVREFNDIVRIAREARLTSRMKGGG